METKIIANPSPEEIQDLGRILRQGGLVAIPTETVYGLGANGLDEEAMSKIYAAKGRPSDNPLILHISSMEEVPPLVAEIPETARRLMEAFWPGPLTITLPKSDFVPLRATGGLARVALRCPDHALARDLIKAAGVPIAAPSANISGRPSPTTAQAVYHDMQGRIEAIVDAGPCSIGVESTVVEVHPHEVIILRPGGITEDMLRTVVDCVSYDKHLLGSQEQPKAPGMKYTHYAPNGDMTTYVGADQEVAQAMVKQIDALLEQTDSKGAVKVGLLVSASTLHVIYDLWNQGNASELTDKLIEDEAVEIIPITYEDDLDLAHSLYQALLDFNDAEVSYILAQGVETKGLGVAIMNRMTKASGGQVITCKEKNVHC